MNALRSTLVDAARFERQALDQGREQLNAGWTPSEVVECLVDAVEVIDALEAETIRGAL